IFASADCWHLSGFLARGTDCACSVENSMLTFCPERNFFGFRQGLDDLFEFLRLECSPELLVEVVPGDSPVGRVDHRDYGVLLSLPVRCSDHVRHHKHIVEPLFTELDRLEYMAH